MGHPPSPLHRYNDKSWQTNVMIWQIRMLGRFEVVAQEQPAPTFRSRKVGSLLALLALHRGKSIANQTLQDLLWPESDGDRQSQSLRRAVADLRDALAREGVDREIVQTGQGRTALDLESFETDVDRFEELLKPDWTLPDFELRAAEALALYGGPLLLPIDDDWILAYRRHIEELYCEALEAYCLRLAERGLSKEAVRLASAGAVLAPLREEPFVAAIRGYVAMGNPSMAIQQFEALEKMLDDNFGQTPSESALQALEVVPLGAEPTPKPQEAEQAAPPAPTGGLPVDTDLYVRRDADGQVENALATGEPLVLVYGPRQVGKTSLVARAGRLCRTKGWTVAISDFQTLGRSEIERPATLYRALIHNLAQQLQLTYEPSWNEWLGANSNMDAQVGALLQQVDGPVLWAMDEVDRLFGTDYADDFFGLVRSWHNRRSLDPDGPWGRLTLIISYATEAHLFINDLNQSPFNVGLRLHLRDFTPEQVSELCRRYGLAFAARSGEVFEVTRGHPFLTRRALAFLQSGRTIDDLRQHASSETGPFGDHLKHILATLKRNPETESEVRRMLQGLPFSDAQTQSRLAAAGLLSMDAAPSSELRVPTYRSFLVEKLDLTSS